MKKSKDIKLIAILFGIELVLIAVLSVVAAVRYGGGTKSDSPVTLNRSANVGDMLFPSSGRLNIGDFPEPVQRTEHTNYPAATAAPTPEPTEVPEVFNYYTFAFDKNGYRSSGTKSTEDGFTYAGLDTGGLTEKKLTVPASKSSFDLGNIHIENDYVGKQLLLTEIFAEPLKLKQMQQGGANQFIVYYTHTYEGYCLTEEEQTKTKRWYTTDNNEANVVCAGTSFYNRLQALGVNGVNNTTVHNDGSDALKSYELSYVTLSGAIAANPDTLLVLDVHRNGVGKLVNGRLYGPTAELDGQKYAKIMFVIGIDYDSDAGEYRYETNPYWKENFKLAFLVLEKLEARVPGITSGIALRKTPYNQQLSPNSLLAEVGFEGNLASEAAATAALLAEVIAEIYSA